jgi:hypothetical protein
LDVSVLPFLKKGPLLLKLLLLTPKPPRLLKIKTGMEPKVLWREATPLSHLPQLSLKTKVQARIGNVRRARLPWVHKPKDVPHEQSTSKNPPASLFDFLEADSYVFIFWPLIIACFYSLIF